MSNQKFIVIGCAAGSQTALDICRDYPLMKDEIIFYEKYSDVPLNERSLDRLDVYEFSMPKLKDNSFYPKAKHLPKGHERPYRFHR